MEMFKTLNEKSAYMPKTIIAAFKMEIDFQIMPNDYFSFFFQCFFGTFVNCI